MRSKHFHLRLSYPFWYLKWRLRLKNDSGKEKQWRLRADVKRQVQRLLGVPRMEWLKALGTKDLNSKQYQVSWVKVAPSRFSLSWLLKQSSDLHYICHIIGCLCSAPPPLDPELMMLCPQPLRHGHQDCPGKPSAKRCSKPLAKHGIIGSALEWSDYILLEEQIKT